MNLLLFIIIGFLLSPQFSWAQKPQVKRLEHRHFSANPKGDLVLRHQIEQDFNKYGKMVREDKSVPDSTGRLRLEAKSVLSYDTRGRHLNTLQYDAANNLVSETKIYWDEQDNRSKEEQIAYQDRQQISVLITYLLEYDAFGNKKLERFFDQDGRLIRERSWFYNKEQEVLRTRTWEEQRNQPRREVEVKYTRGKNGEVVQAVTTEKINRKEFRKDVVYFNNSLVVRWRKYLNGKFESEFINEYRDTVVIRTTMSNKRKVLSLEQAEKYRRKMERKKKRNQSQGNKGRRDEEELWVTNSEYDGYGNLLMTTQTANEQVVSITQYTYDDYGNRTKTVKVDKQKNLKEEERLSYDQNGNIAKRISIQDDQTLSEDHYSYEYYERE